MAVNLVVPANHLGMLPPSLGQKKFLPFAVEDDVGNAWTLIQVDYWEESWVWRPPGGAPTGYIRAPEALQTARPPGGVTWRAVIDGRRVRARACAREHSWFAPTPATTRGLKSAEPSHLLPRYWWRPERKPPLVGVVCGNGGRHRFPARGRSFCTSSCVI